MKIKIPYKYICVEGNIGAGKTSLCEMLANDFSCNLILEEFAENPFLEYFYKDPARYAFTVELFFLNERQKQLQATVTQNELFSDFSLADYSLIKSMLFARQNLQAEEFKLFQKIFNTLSQQIPRPDLILYLHRPIDNLKQHITDRGRSYEMNMDVNYLEAVQNSYFDFFKTQTIIPVLVLDAEHLDFINNPRHYEEIKRILTQKFQPGLHHQRILF